MLNKHSRQKYSFLEGLEFYYQGNYESAIKVFTHIAKYDPLHPLVNEFKEKAQKERNNRTIPQSQLPFEIRKAKFKAELLMQIGNFDEARSQTLLFEEKIKSINSRYPSREKNGGKKLVELEKEKKLYEKTKKLIDDGKFEQAFENLRKKKAALITRKIFELDKNIQFVLETERQLQKKTTSQEYEISELLNEILHLKIKLVVVENHLGVNPRIYSLTQKLDEYKEFVIQAYINCLPKKIEELGELTTIENMVLAEKLKDQINFVFERQKDSLELESWLSIISRLIDRARIQLQNFEVINSYIESREPTSMILAFKLLSSVEDKDNKKFDDCAEDLLSKLIAYTERVLLRNKFILSFKQTVLLKQLLRFASNLNQDNKQIDKKLRKLRGVIRVRQASVYIIFFTIIMFIGLVVYLSYVNIF